MKGNFDTLIQDDRVIKNDLMFFAGISRWSQNDLT